MREIRHRLRGELILRRDREELVIHDPIGDHTHLLNRTAARVAELCDGRHTMREIGAILEREFPVALTDEVDLVDEATAIVAELKRAGLVEETGA